MTRRIIEEVECEHGLVEAHPISDIGITPFDPGYEFCPGGFRRELIAREETAKWCSHHDTLVYRWLDQWHCLEVDPLHPELCHHVPVLLVVDVGESE